MQASRVGDRRQQRFLAAVLAVAQDRAADRGAMDAELMRAAGAYTVGQSQSSALVYGMPRVAFEEGAVIEQAPVEQITAKLAAALTRIKSAA